MSTSTLHLGIFYMPQICDMGTMALLPLRRKACWGFFSPLKIRQLRPGLNTRSWVLKASTLPLDHRSRLWCTVTHTSNSTARYSGDRSSKKLIVLVPNKVLPSVIELSSARSQQQHNCTHVSCLLHSLQRKQFLCQTARSALICSIWKTCFPHDLQLLICSAADSAVCITQNSYNNQLWHHPFTTLFLDILSCTAWCRHTGISIIIETICVHIHVCTFQHMYVHIHKIVLR